MDSALLVVAASCGFAEAEGVELSLHRETSWATLRDRLAVGQVQVAHMLGPMPVACNLGLAPLASRLVVPMALGLGGNAVTVSNPLWARMASEGAAADLEPGRAGQALRAALGRPTGGERPRFAVVHPHSSHAYELRYWLAASRIVPDRDVEFVVLPPSRMPDALSSGAIDGFCAGEPWGTAAVTKGLGRIATVKAAIWRNSPEKVLAVDAAWADSNPDALNALLRALQRAAAWCGDRSNHRRLATLLADPAHVDCPEDWFLPGLTGELALGEGASTIIPDFFVPQASAATFPWKSHALWFYSQMVRWGQVSHSPDAAATATETYRPDLYRRALGPLGVALPSANAKVEGALDQPTPVGSAGASLVLGPDGFFDGARFDPDSLDAYISGQRDFDGAQKL